MQKDQINQLARRLELAERNDLYSANNALIKDIERLARIDLNTALRIWEIHASKELKDHNLRPEILTVAAVIEKHYEGRSEQARADVALANRDDAVVCRPTSNRDYVGVIVGQTQDYFVQKSGEDYVLHKRESLTVDPKAMGDDVKVRYPFKAIGGVGIVTQNEAQLSRGQSEFQSQKTLAIKQADKELDL